MNDLAVGDFREFFHELHKRPPFPWQERLAEQVCLGDWPEVIDLPTASGKTACLDIALFALALKDSAPRRLFFVVDRRIVVNDTYLRMRNIADRLKKAEGGILGKVAAALRALAGKDSKRPLEVTELRGGIYRDQAWVRSPLQPTVITSTVDQVGSRLLFRGYGVSDSSAPIHAALIANDALIFLDEAHCSRAFAQTLAAVKRYRGEGWAKKPIGRPFGFVEMTATPGQAGDLPRFSLGPEDRENEVLAKRLFAKKPTLLREEKAKADDADKLAQALVKQALALAEESGGKRIAVMVNRVATALKAFDHLKKTVSGAEKLELLIGRMRPVDRDLQIDRLKHLKAGMPREPDAARSFVVSTQCLEVGADLDFDVLVSECASIDALMQRFGRLDRLGELEGKARGCIVMPGGAKDIDPIYGASLKKTWTWLAELGGESRQVEMGIEGRDGEPATVAQLLKVSGDPGDALRRTGLNAPALLPAHLDALVQTSPKPHCEPDVSLFLHGAEESSPEVQVIWRADLEGARAEDWKALVSLCPPVSAEAMPVRLWEFERWLNGKRNESAPDADIEGLILEDEDRRGREKKEETGERNALIWRGDKSGLAVGGNGKSIKPGDTLIIPLRDDGTWKRFGHMPEPVLDVAEQAILQARRRFFIRLNRKVLARPGQEVKYWPAEERLDEREKEEWVSWLQEFGAALATGDPLKGVLNELRDPRGLKLVEYPSEGDTAEAWLLRSTRPIQFEEDSGEDEISREGVKVSLEQHTRDVVEEAGLFANAITPQFEETLREAARFHDSGKVDGRFQAMLHGGDRISAACSVLLAKGDVLSMAGYQAAKERCRLPDRFRHELLSLHFVKAGCGARPDLDLLLHLIATHHGYCRPFAPIVLDGEPEDVTWESYKVCKCERANEPAHGMGAGVARRFWFYTREFGWWGSAYLEAMLRLADWAASGREAGKVK